MLKLENLTITNVKGRVLVKDFSFVLNEGDKIALIGEEGNGKSTILKIIAGIDVSDYCSYEGSIIYDGIIGYLPQNIEDEYLDNTVTDYICDGEIDYTKLYDAVKQTNLNAVLLQDRIIKTLSGGEKVKATLARILYKQPDVLLLDEPTNDLDLKTLIWLEEFIKNNNLPIIFISHDETLLENCSNGILHLEQLKRKTETKLTYTCVNYKDYVEIRKYNIERNNAIAKKEKSEFNKQLEKYRQIYQKVENDQKNISRQDPHGGALLKKKMHAVKSLGRNLDIKKKNLTLKFEPEEAINISFEKIDINPNKVILDFHMDKLVVDDNILANDIKLYVQGKNKICIVGDNGNGKTTLIKQIYKSLSIRDDIKLGYMSQNYYEVMDYDLTPVEFLLINQEYKKKTEFTTYLGSLKFTAEEMGHRISELSEGQKCKLLIIKMIVDKCDVLLLDEPTRNLSPLSNPKVRQILNEYGGCIISISHDRKFIDEVCDVVYRLDDTLTKL